MKEAANTKIPISRFKLNKILPLVAPKTFLIPISLIRFMELYLEKLKRPRHARKIAIKEPAVTALL